MSYTFEQSKLVSIRRLFLAFLLLLLANLVLILAANAQTPDNPMESKYSQEIRKEYAKCRELDSPVAQYLCSCRILEKQCEVPRKETHGNWNTVEYWPSDDPAEREVQFMLFMNYDTIGDFRPGAFGVVYTCMSGEASLNVYLGTDVDETISPIVYIGETKITGEIFEDEGRYMVEFFETEKLFKTLSKSEQISVVFEDMEGKESFLEFDSFGFANVSVGWEPVCEAPKRS